MLKPRKCPNCKERFVPTTPHHMFCCKRCRDGYAKSKTWESYFAALIRNSKVARKALSTEILAEIFEQQGGCCALSGIPLTKITGKGQVSTNASIDRIEPGGEYEKSNVRLVCNSLNSFRGNLSDAEFIWFCRKVSEFNNGA